MYQTVVEAILGMIRMGYRDCQATMADSSSFSVGDGGVGASAR